MNTPKLHLDPSCVEARGLALGLRKAWRLRMQRDDVADFADFAAVFTGLGLAVVRSEQTFADLPGGRLHVDAEGLALVVVAVDRATAQHALTLELENAVRGHGSSASLLAATVDTHRQLGALYGYPSCCVDAFCDAHAESILAGRSRGAGADDSAVHDNALQLLRAADRSGAFHPLLRAFGQRLGDQTASPLRHMPCAFDCPPSIALAEALVADLAATNPALHAAYTSVTAVDLAVDATGIVRPALSTTADQQTLGLDPMSRFPRRLPFASCGAS